MKFNKSITGFDNENEIAEDLNDKFITELNPLYRIFIEVYILIVKVTKKLVVG